MNKNNLIVFLLISISLVFLNCKTKKIECNSFQTKKIKIVNNISHHYSGLKNVEIKNLEQINEVCVELNNNQLLVKNAVTNYHTGFIEILVIGNNFNNHLFSIIFSKVDGYLIHYNNTNFKNDRLLKLILTILDINSELVLSDESSIIKTKQNNINNSVKNNGYKIIKKVGDFS